MKYAHCQVQYLNKLLKLIHSTDLPALTQVKAISSREYFLAVLTHDTVAIWPPRLEVGRENNPGSVCFIYIIVPARP